MRNHRESTQNPVRMNLQERDAFDQRVREAVRRLRRSCKSAPHPRWRWEDVEGLRYNPLRVVADMIDGAIAGGATEDDCYSMTTVLMDHIARHFPAEAVEPVREASRIETAHEGEANSAQHRLVCEPTCPSALHNAEEKLGLHLRALAALHDSVRATRLRISR